MALAAEKQGFTAQDYLDWESRQTERHEYLAGEVFAMTGARATHNIIAGNFFATLRTQLRGTPCQAFIADMKLRVETLDAFFYPDVFVTCQSRDLGPEGDLYKRFPLLVVEVLSDSTAAYDRGLKFEYYQKLDSLCEYLLVEQDRRHADLFRRNAQGLWVLHPIDQQGVVTLESVGISLDLDVIYEDVRFDTPAHQAPV